MNIADRIIAAALSDTRRHGTWNHTNRSDLVSDALSDSPDTHDAIADILSVSTGDDADDAAVGRIVRRAVRRYALQVLADDISDAEAAEAGEPSRDELDEKVRRDDYADRVRDFRSAA